ncbi:MAG: hypothetical protein KatS3mg029_0175 [Saprospiraceae bacterium]|nr:MAG: hypothetical protein KatS3mg029_0175 [Saprospiraceae bacterium]
MLLICFAWQLTAQEQARTMEGEVTFLSSRNVYVKFPSTEQLEVGDTLYVRQDGRLTPALVLKAKSSTSTVCELVGDANLAVKSTIVALLPPPPPTPEPPQPQEPEPSVETVPKTETVKPSFEEESEQSESPFKQRIRGNISAASYSTTSDYGDNHRMRYGVNFKGTHLNGSRFSMDAYVTFRHTLDRWSEVEDNIFNALKIYSLAGKYDFDNGTLIAGRSINYKISSMGAIDGLQYEHNFGPFVGGAILGFRPDYSDYGFNPSLIQAGAFISHQLQDNRGYSTLALVEQHNGSAVDRRFIYFQHSSSPLENLNLFGSFEVDAYQKVNGEVSNSLQLTNFYFSARYRFSRQLSLTASYDNRNNIIYYESYKNFIDKLIEDETRQGLRLGVSWRPVRLVSIGVNGSWRFQKSNANLSRNLNAYVNFNRLPLAGVQLSLRGNLLETNYLNSQRYGVRLSRSLLKGKFSAEAHYDFVNYHYTTTGFSFQQHIAGASLNVRVLKKLSLYMYYEGAFDQQNRVINRFNTKLIQRF